MIKPLADIFALQFWENKPLPIIFARHIFAYFGYQPIFALRCWNYFA